MKTRNTEIKMTRRYFELSDKQKIKDSKISRKLIYAWDIEQNSKKVLEIFLKSNKKLSSQRYWELLRTVWIVSGGLETIHLFLPLFKAPIKNKYCFSTSEESRKLRELPQKINVYRACNKENDGGISWTYEKKYAEMYKNMFGKKLIVSKTIDKKEIFALIDRNDEYELLIIN